MPSHTIAIGRDPVDSRDTGERTVHSRLGPAQWCVREAWRDRLLGPDAPDWFALERADGAALVKKGDARSIWRVTLGAAAVFAKVVDNARFLDRLKSRFTGDVLQREWRTSLEAESRGVPVVRHLALGVRAADPSRAVLLSEELPGTVRLLDAWRRNVESMPRGGRRAAAGALIETVGDLFAAAHERGFVHRDAHPGNILLRTDPDGGQRAVFVDLGSARLMRRPASPRQSIRAMAQLDQHFHRCATRTERLRFVRNYMRRRPTLGASWDGRSYRREALAQLRRASVVHAERLARTRDRRIRRNGHYFATLSPGGGWTATVVLRLERRHIFPETDTPDLTASTWRGILTRPIARLADLPATGASFEENGFRIEMCRIRGLSARILATMGGSAHRRAFVRCHRQRHRDIRNELILGCAEHRRGGLVDAALLIRPGRDEKCSADAASQTGERRGDGRDRDRTW